MEGREELAGKAETTSNMLTTVTQIRTYLQRTEGLVVREEMGVLAALAAMAEPAETAAMELPAPAT